ncbi:hypothetical protein X975_09402, partial [Stegodyphus mimosarum]
MSATKRQKRENSASIEEMYQNKIFIPPKEKNLETIFEEPRESKDGAPILTSVRKYRRYLQFDPTQGKIQKRKIKAKKCSKKLHINTRTRSAKKTEQCEDISSYILDVLGDSSNDGDLDVNDCKNGIAEKSETSMTLENINAFPKLIKSFETFVESKSTSSEPVHKDSVHISNKCIGTEPRQETETSGEVEFLKACRSEEELSTKSKSSENSQNEIMMANTEIKQESDSPKKSCIVT